jgi:hypothetical protein
MKFPKFPKWQDGRQGTGYKVLTLINSKLLKLDLHILKYPEGTYIPSHIDPAREGYEHYRLNIVLKKAKYGGSLIVNETLYKSPGSRIIFFRPDISRHLVTNVYEGTRYVLSIGWLKKARSLV